MKVKRRGPIIDAIEIKSDNAIAVSDWIIGHGVDPWIKFSLGGSLDGFSWLVPNWSVVKAGIGDCLVSEAGDAGPFHRITAEALASQFVIIEP